VDLIWSGLGTARFALRLSPATGALLESMFATGVAPLVARAALAFDGVSPRLDEVAAFDPRALVARLAGARSLAELAAGGGFKRGCIVGATDKLGEQVTDKFYKVESFGRTLYHLLGIDADTIVQAGSGRPIRLIAEDAPLIKEALV
jgi:hypothetical protein